MNENGEKNKLANEIAMKAKSGDEKSKVQLIRQFEPMLWKLASQYAGKYGTDNADDLYQEGAIALIKCLDTWDIEKGRLFSNYAYFAIQTTLNRYQENTSHLIKIPSYIQKGNTTLYKAYYELKKEGNFRPSDEELIDKTGLTMKQLSRFRNIASLSQCNELDALALNDDGNGKTLLDLIGTMDDEQTDDEELNHKLLDTIGKLSQTKQYIVCHSFGLNCEKMTKTAMSKKLKLSVHTIDYHLKESKKIIKRSLERYVQN